MNNDFIFDQPDDSTGFLLWQVNNLWQREIKKALAVFKLTHAQFVLLANIHWLSQHEYDVTQIKLAQHAKMDPMTTSTVLRTLQSKGLVKRVEHETDTRSKTVTLTELGLEMVKQAIVKVEAFDQYFFAVLGQQKNTFNSNLIHLVKQDLLD
jgi:DNA-binding MarR family transcriptional regulator